MAEPRDLVAKRTGADLAKGAAAKTIKTGFGGWIEDRGNKLIGWAISAVSGAAVSARAWFEQHWFDAARATVLAVIGSYFLYRITRGIWGIWRTNHLVLQAAEESRQAVGALESSVSSLLAGQASVAPVSSDPSTSPAAVSLSSAKAGSVKIEALGIFRTITFSYIVLGREECFRCVLVADFVSLKPCDPSPLELRLTAAGDSYELAKLAVLNGHVSACPTEVGYYGEGKWADLMDVAKATMKGDLFEGPNRPWSVVPPRGSLYCRLDIRLPDGAAGRDHIKSAVRFPFELTGERRHPIVARIEPWDPGAASPGTATRL